MSITPTFFRGRRTTVNDPLSVDVASEIASLADTCINRKETADAHVFTADVPGLKKEEVKVEVEDDRILLIRGVRNAEKVEKTDTLHRVERSSGKFLRRFGLPKNAKVDQVKAEMENGVLTVTVPKVEKRPM